MRAWRVYGPNDIRFDDVPVPEPMPGDALLRVLTFQPSITEVVGLSGIGLGGEQVARAQSTGHPVQLFGHEFCGQVVSIRGDTHGLKVGDRVASLGRVPCGSCAACLAHRPFYCRNGEVVGITRAGCFAEYLTAPTRGLVRIPSELSDSDAAMLQPIASLLGALAVVPRSSLVGANIAVLGLGVMGLMAGQLARAFGAKVVVGASTRRSAVELATSCGFMSYHLPTDCNGLTRFRDACSVVLNCSAMTAIPDLGIGTASLALDLSAAGGTVVQIAVYERPIEVDTSVMRSKCLHYTLPRFSTRRELASAASLAASNSVRISAIRTRVLNGLEQLPAAFELIRDKSTNGVTGPVQVVVARAV